MKDSTIYSTGEMGNSAFAGLDKKIEAKAASQDPFAITPLAEVDAKAEDLEAAKTRALEEAFKKSALETKAGEFVQQIFPVMAGLVERRETARGVSEKNFALNEGQVRAYLERKPPAGTIARTAYIMAAVKAGIQIEGIREEAERVAAGTGDVALVVAKP